MKNLHYSKRDRKSMLAIISLIIGIGLIVSFDSKTSEEVIVDFSEFSRKVDSIEHNKNYEKKPPQSSVSSKVFAGKTRNKTKAKYNVTKPRLKTYAPATKDSLSIKPRIDGSRKNSSSNKSRKSYTKYTHKRISTTKLDVNLSAPIDWESLRGIGPYYSRLITNFRDKLGGFSSIDQISETYNLPDSTFSLIKPHLEISPIFARININQATEEDLQKHPYINWREAKLIVRYRDEHGLYHAIEELNKIRAFDHEWLNQIYPYLTTNMPEPTVALDQ